MRAEKLTEKVVVRMPKEMRLQVARLARDRHLKEADILREGIREYLEPLARPVKQAA